MEIDAVYGDKGKIGKHAKGKKGKDKGKGKHKGKHESSPKFEGYCGHCGKWGHKQKDCRYKNTVAEVDEESVEQPNSSASSSTTRVTQPPPGLCSGSVNGGWLGRVCTTLHLHAPYITHSTSASFVLLFVFSLFSQSRPFVYRHVVCVDEASACQMLPKYAFHSCVR